MTCKVTSRGLPVIEDITVFPWCTFKLKILLFFLGVPSTYELLVGEKVVRKFSWLCQEKAINIKSHGTSNENMVLKLKNQKNNWILNGTVYKAFINLFIASFSQFPICGVL